MEVGADPPGGCQQQRAGDVSRPSPATGPRPGLPGSASASAPRTRTLLQPERSTRPGRSRSARTPSATAASTMEDTRSWTSPRPSSSRTTCRPGSAASSSTWRTCWPVPGGEADRVAPAWHGWREHDATLPYRVVRMPRRLPVAHPAACCIEPGAGRGAPGPRSCCSPTASRVTGIGAALAERGLPYVALTHGYEVWMSLSPGFPLAHFATPCPGHEVFAISAVHRPLGCSGDAPGSPPVAGPPCVDPTGSAPASTARPSGSARTWPGCRWSGCVGRLVQRKGQDVLIRALPEILRRAYPTPSWCWSARALRAGALRRLAAASPARDRIRFAGEVRRRGTPLGLRGDRRVRHAVPDAQPGVRLRGVRHRVPRGGGSGSPWSRDAPAGAAEAVVDGETGLGRRRTRPGERRRRVIRAAARTRQRREGHGRGRPGAGRGTVHLGPHRRAGGASPARRGNIAHTEARRRAVWPARPSARCSGTRSRRSPTSPRCPSREGEAWKTLTWRDYGEAVKRDRPRPDRARRGAAATPSASCRRNRPEWHIADVGGLHRRRDHGAGVPDQLAAAGRLHPGPLRGEGGLRRERGAAAEDREGARRAART